MRLKLKPLEEQTIVIAAAAGAGLAGAAFASWLLKPAPQGDQKPSERADENDLGEQPRADDIIVASERERLMETAG